MSKHKSILFLPSTTTFSPIPECIKWIRGRLSLSVSSSFWTCLISSYLCSSSSPCSPTSPFFHHLPLSLHPYLGILLSPPFLFFLFLSLSYIFVFFTQLFLSILILIFTFLLLLSSLFSYLSSSS